MPNEVWKDIKGYEGLYQVSSLGRVRSLTHKCSVSGRVSKGRLLKNTKYAQGYLYVHLSNDGKKLHHCIHRLVADAFIPNPNRLPQVNHKDENPLNNTIDNLEWCSRSYNINYGSRNKKVSDKLTNGNLRSKRTAVYSLDNELLCIYPSTNEASRKTGVNEGSISSNCLGKTKNTHGYIFKYV